MKEYCAIIRTRDGKTSVVSQRLSTARDAENKQVRCLIKSLENGYYGASTACQKQSLQEKQKEGSSARLVRNIKESNPVILESGKHESVSKELKGTAGVTYQVFTMVRSILMVPTDDIGSACTHCGLIALIPAPKVSRVALEALGEKGNVCIRVVGGAYAETGLVSRAPFVFW